MHYSQALGYSIVPINKKSFSLEEVEVYKQQLFELFGVDFIYIFLFLNWNMMIPNDSDTVRATDTSKDPLIISNILRPEIIKKAVEILNDDEVNSLYKVYYREEMHHLYHHERQREIIEIAQKIYEKICVILNIRL